VHEEISKTNMSLHSAAYSRKRENDGSGDDATVAPECDGVGQIQLASDPVAARAYAAHFKVKLGELPGLEQTTTVGSSATGGSSTTSKKRGADRTIEDMLKKSKKGE
jgi:hypothetical protein